MLNGFQDIAPIPLITLGDSVVTVGGLLAAAVLTNWSSDTPSFAASSPAFFRIESGNFTLIAVMSSSPVRF